MPYYGSVSVAPLMSHTTARPDDRDAVRELARLLAERGDLDGAAQILRGLADAGDRYAVRELARLLAERGDLDGAA